MTLEFRYALRQLTKSPGFTFIAIVALALGIGANTALFSIVDAIFLRPLPYAHADQLVHLTSSIPEQDFNNVPFSWPRYLAVRDHQQVFSGIAAGTFQPFTVTNGGEAEQINGFLAQSGYLSVLGVQPLVGRNFTAEEDRPGGANVALLSHSYWQKQYNGSRAALGQSIVLDGQSYTIVGILPPAMSRFPFNQVSIWTPRPQDTTGLVPVQLNNGAMGFEVIGRLKPGVTLARAREQVKLLAAGYAQANPKNVDAPAQASVNSYLRDVIGDQRQTYTTLCGAVGCVLLIACANVANLLLARFAGRQKEIALRFALGASRGQVVRQLLIESLLVAFAGAIAGFAIAYWGLSLFTTIGSDFIPRAAEIALDPMALGFTAGLALLTGLGMGLFPAMQAAKQDVNNALKESSRGSSQGRSQGRFRGALLVSEIALSLILLVCASLLLTSFARLQHVTLGFRPDKIFVGFLTVPNGKYSSKPELAGYYHRLVERVAAIPGVEAAAVDDSPPMTGANGQAPVAVVGRPLPPLSERQLANRHLVSPGAFATLGIPLQAGRDFTERDDPTVPHTVIINQAFARKFFPDQNPIGQKLVTGMAQLTAEIVGVVGDTRSVSLTAAPTPEYFLPALQRPEQFTTIIARTSLDPAAITSAVRAAMHEVDAGIPLTNPQTMTTLIARSVADRRLVMTLLAAFAGLAVVLASIGVYSVMAYTVTQRTVEIGIRLALGATPTGVQSMVLRQGMTLVGVGILVGVAAALGCARILSTLLYEVRANDPLVYLAVAALICVIGAAACWLPARRATSVDPLLALRAQ